MSSEEITIMMILCKMHGGKIVIPYEMMMDNLHDYELRRFDDVARMRIEYTLVKKKPSE